MLIPEATGNAGPGPATLGAWLVFALLLTAYLSAASRERGGKRGWSGWRIASFVAGIGLLAVAVSPPLSMWAHRDLRGHMVQHLLLGMFAPLCLVLATPGTLLFRTLPVHTSRRITAGLRSRPIRWLSHPLSALTLDTGALYLLYLTPLYAVTLADPLLHRVVHVHFLAAGYLFVWSIAGRDPAPHRASFRMRLGALFCAIAAHSTLAKLMHAQIWPRGTHHTIEQIRDAAQLMYYGGDLAEMLLAVALFASRYAVSERRRRCRAQARQRDLPAGEPSARHLFLDAFPSTSSSAPRGIR